MAVYNESFRVKVVEFLMKSHSSQKTAEICGVSIRSNCAWSKIAKQGKRLKFKKVQRSPHCVNCEELLAYVREHPNAHLKEINAKFIEKRYVQKA